MSRFYVSKYLDTFRRGRGPKEKFAGKFFEWKRSLRLLTHHHCASATVPRPCKGRIYARAWGPLQPTAFDQYSGLLADIRSG